mmetsp:Transcript_30511/g.87464  ORF Transcript_30511/g.87464 Transcript_30511/m.87464 type:complete len:377 (-) Transcript_30511:7-1137(-)
MQQIAEGATTNMQSTPEKTHASTFTNCAVRLRIMGIRGSADRSGAGVKPCTAYKVLSKLLQHRAPKASKAARWPHLEGSAGASNPMWMQRNQQHQDQKVLALCRARSMSQGKALFKLFTGAFRSHGQVGRCARRKRLGTRAVCGTSKALVQCDNRSRGPMFVLVARLGHCILGGFEFHLPNLVVTGRAIIVRGLRPGLRIAAVWPILEMFIVWDVQCLDDVRNSLVFPSDDDRRSIRHLLDVICDARIIVLVAIRIQRDSRSMREGRQGVHGAMRLAVLGLCSCQKCRPPIWQRIALPCRHAPSQVGGAVLAVRGEPISAVGLLPVADEVHVGLACRGWPEEMNHHRGRQQANDHHGAEMPKAALSESRHNYRANA